MIDRKRLLSLEPADVEWRALLASVAHELFEAVIISRTPHQTALYHRMSHPVPGDYVFEVTTYWRGGPHSTGFLQKTANEPYEDYDDDPAPTRDVWYVQYGPADDDVVRWEDCRFYTIPVDRASFSKEIEELAAAFVRSGGARCAFVRSGDAR